MSWHPAETATCTGDTPCDPIDLVIRPREHDLGGFTVRRVLPVRERRMVGPFVFFDQMGPATLPPDQAVSVRPHPHIGLSTLTWLFEGSILHRDSLGCVQEIVPGEVNWMTAGSGIVHSERSPDSLAGREKPLFGLQVWLALPRNREEVDPSFQHCKADEIPVMRGDGVTATVVAGSAWGLTSPVAVFSNTLYVDVAITAGATLVLGHDHEERAVYPVLGEVEIAGQRFAPGAMLVLKPEAASEIKAATDARLVLIGGDRMDGPRHMFWNFVSSRKERIERAKADWRDGRFAEVPGETERIPLPEG